MPLFTRTRKLKQKKLSKERIKLKLNCQLIRDRRYLSSCHLRVCFQNNSPSQCINLMPKKESQLLDQTHPKRSKTFECSIKGEAPHSFLHTTSSSSSLAFSDFLSSFLLLFFWMVAETLGDFILVVSSSLNRKEKKRRTENHLSRSLFFSFALSVLLAENRGENPSYSLLFLSQTEPKPEEEIPLFSSFIHH